MLSTNLISELFFFSRAVVTEFKTAKVFPCISQHAQGPVGIRRDREQTEELFQRHTEKTLFADSSL